MRIQPQQKPSSIRLTPFLLLIVLAAIGYGVYLFSANFEGEPPVIRASIGTAWNPCRETTVHIVDRKSGIRRVQIVVSQQGRDIPLFDKLFEKDVPKTLDLPIKVDLRKHRISDGAAVLRITARDKSWRGWFHGNKSDAVFNTVIDTKAPRINVLTRFHNVYLGGAGLVIYQLSKACPEHGVLVGDRFFPGISGMFKNPLTMAALIAVDHKAGAGTEMAVTATDEAGNPAKASFPYHILRKSFRRETIPITDAFLQQKMPEFQIDPSLGENWTPLEKFTHINQQQRETDNRKLGEIAKTSAPSMLWDGTPFLRLPNAAPKAGFGDHRIYLYKGRVIDEQAHMGVDLASVQQSPVPAAHSGVVVECGTFGIYGNTVIIDHGLGLFSMYAHLSTISVKPGQTVRKADIIGNTGMSGLAAGDHLHFAMILRDQFINPIEWWDESWIQNNITGKIQDIRSLEK